MQSGTSSGRVTDREQTDYFWMLVGGLLAAHVALAWYFRQGILFGEDDAGYVLLARSLGSLNYRELHEVGEPIAARFPPLYPAFLAVLRLVFGERESVFSAASVILDTASLALLAATVRHLFGSPVALATTAIAALSARSAGYTSRIMAEPLFTLCLVVGLWAYSKDASARRRWVGAIALIASALVRTAGAAFVLGLAGWLAVRRERRRLAMTFVAASATVGAWGIWTLLAPNAAYRRLYVADVAGLIDSAKRLGKQAGGTEHPVADVAAVIIGLGRHVAEAVRFYAVEQLPVVLALPTIPGTPIDNIAWLLLLGALVAAGVATCVKRWPVAVAVLGAYAALLIAWRYATARFLVPIAPLIVVVAFVGLQRLVRSGRAFNIAAASLTGLLLVGQVQGLRREWAHKFGCAVATARGCIPPEQADLLEAAEWLRDNTAPGTRVMSTKERAMYYHSGRQLVNHDYARSLPDSVFVSFLRSQGVSHAVQSTYGYGTRASLRRLRASCRAFDVAHRVSDDVVVLRVRKEDAGGNACDALEAYVRANPAMVP